MLYKFLALAEIRVQIFEPVYLLENSIKNNIFFDLGAF
jgi:hypothetical protein